MKPDAADIFFLSGLALVALGLYLCLPLLLPWYLIVVGVLFILLGVNNVLRIVRAKGKLLVKK